MFNVKNLTQNETKEHNILVFAYVGDSVHSLFVRSKLATESFLKPGMLNKKANKIVSAKGQSLAFEKIKSEFNENELTIANTARNTHTENIAKNSTIEDYRKATSLEAVFGYLYLLGEEERLTYLLNLAYGVIANEN